MKVEKDEESIDKQNEETKLTFLLFNSSSSRFCRSWMMNSSWLETNTKQMKEKLDQTEWRRKKEVNNDKAKQMKNLLLPCDRCPQHAAKKKRVQFGLLEISGLWSKVKMNLLFQREKGFGSFLSCGALRFQKVRDFVKSHITLMKRYSRSSGMIFWRECQIEQIFFFMRSGFNVIDQIGSSQRLFNFLNSTTRKTRARSEKKGGSMKANQNLFVIEIDELFSCDWIF